MKLEPVAKLEKRNMATSKKKNDYVMSTNCDIIVFFLFMVNFQLSESQIPDASSIKLTFLLTITFYLINIENRTKNIKHSSHAIALNKGTIFAKKCCKKKS